MPLPVVLAPARAEDAASNGTASGLTVAILDLAEIPGLAPPPPSPEVRRPTWRTTFGSERETQPEVKAVVVGPIAALADADAVLIQGVRAAARLRRMFPPRTWRLIVSRRVLSATDPVGLRTVRGDLPPSTAIAVKARADLRLTARAHSLSLGEESAAASFDLGHAAATAVRLIDGRGRTLWLASVALPPSCSGENPPCPALATLDAWRQDKLRNDEPTVIGGRIGARAAPKTSKSGDTPAACSVHAIESDLPWTRLPPPPDAALQNGDAGCIAIVRLAD